MARPRTTPGMKYASLERHGYVLVACLGCLKELGVTSIGEVPPGFHWLEEVEFDHNPALGFGKQFHRAKYLAPACDDHHLVKTKKDLSAIARMKALADSHKAFVLRMRDKRPGEPRQVTHSIASPGFDKRFVRHMDGSRTPRIQES